MLFDPCTGFSRQEERARAGRPSSVATRAPLAHAAPRETPNLLLEIYSPRRVGLGLRRERRARMLLLLACGVRNCSSNLAPDVAKRQRNMSLHLTAGQCARSR